MNILPHKSWHVRTKKNIDRVRKDEAKAAEEEKEKQRRIQLAAQEARTSFLRDRAQSRINRSNTVDPEAGTQKTQVDSKDDDPFSASVNFTQSDGHVNFFQDLEDGNRQSMVQANPEHEAEKKQEQETHEKKIGLLVYLGQDNQFDSKDKPWYKSVHREGQTGVGIGIGVTGSTLTLAASGAPDKDQQAKELRQTRYKELEDPLKNIRKYLNTSGIQSVGQSKSKAIAAINSKISDGTSTSISSISKNKSAKKSHKEKHKHHKSKHKKSKKHKRHSSKSQSASESSDSESNDDDYIIQKRKKLEVLRAERLQREREERRKAEKLLATLRGETEPPPPVVPESNKHIREPPKLKQKYNSQFNPQLARQNYD